jgi:DNA-binding NtrC family response regulator
MVPGEIRFAITVRILLRKASENYQDFIRADLAHFESKNQKSQNLKGDRKMVIQSLMSTRPDEISAHRVMRANSATLRYRIADIRALISSLTAAVEDLDATDLPALNEDFDFYGEVRRFEILLIRNALRVSGGSQIKAAKLLKLKATTLNTKLKTYQLHTYQR